MKNKAFKRCVIVLSEFFPPSKAGGGVMISIKNLIVSASSYFDFVVYSSRNDLGSDEVYSDLDIAKATENLKAKFVYVDGFFKKILVIFSLVCSLRNDQVLYVNSFFNKIFSIWPVFLTFLMRKNIVIAPRGEFSIGALDIRKKRKSIYIAFFRKVILSDRVIFHVSNKKEKEDVQRLFGTDCMVEIATNIASTPSTDELYDSSELKNKFVFCSRISKKKNLKVLIQYLGKMKSENVFIDIYGPIEDPEYWAECVKEISLLPSNVTVKYMGPLSPEDVSGALMGYKAMLFLTLGENYGHVIAESLQVGVPVVLANTTPWLDLDEKGVGWIVSLNNPEQILSVLEKVAGLSESERMEYRKRCLTYAEKISDVRANVREHIRLFENVAKLQGMPEPMECSTSILNVAFVPDRMAHYRKHLIEAMIDLPSTKITILGDDQLDSSKIKVDVPSLNNNSQFFTVNNVFYKHICVWQKGMVSFVFRSSPDVLIAWGDCWRVSTWIAAILQRLRGKKVVFWTHGFYGDECRMKYSIRKIFYMLADHVLLYGDRGCQLMKTAGFSPDRLTVIYNSLQQSTKPLIKADKAYTGNASELRLLFISRLSPVKRVDLLVEAVSQLCIEGRYDSVSLRIVGDGSERTVLEELVSELGIHENVDFLGEIHDEGVIAELMIWADMVVSPGNAGLNVIHAFSYYKPMVTHDDWAEQMPEAEAVKNGETGRLFENGSVLGLVKAIIEVKNDLENGKIDTSNYENVLNKYCVRFQMKRLNDVLQKVSG
jgi:glycosyltransferase involved in cell wall biosynthesis